jgi:hypothetical protein
MTDNEVFMFSQKMYAQFHGETGMCGQGLNHLEIGDNGNTDQIDSTYELYTKPLKTNLSTG